MQNIKTSKDSTKSSERNSELIPDEVKTGIKQAIKKNNGNATAAAEDLGISRQVLSRIIEKKKAWTASPTTILTIKQKLGIAA